MVRPSVTREREGGPVSLFLLLLLFFLFSFPVACSSLETKKKRHQQTETFLASHSEASTSSLSQINNLAGHFFCVALWENTNNETIHFPLKMSFINCSQICQFKMSGRSKCVFHLCFFKCGGERLKKGEKRLKDSRGCLNLFILSRRR